jgi:hypothetical protein
MNHTRNSTKANLLRNTCTVLADRIAAVREIAVVQPAVAVRTVALEGDAVLQARLAASDFPHAVGDD